MCLTASWKVRAVLLLYSLSVNVLKRSGGCRLPHCCSTTPSHGRWSCLQAHEDQLTALDNTELQQPGPAERRLREMALDTPGVPGSAAEAYTWPLLFTDGEVIPSSASRDCQG